MKQMKNNIYKTSIFSKRILKSNIMKICNYFTITCLNYIKVSIANIVLHKAKRKSGKCASLQIPAQKQSILSYNCEIVQFSVAKVIRITHNTLSYSQNNRANRF